MFYRSCLMVVVLLLAPCVQAQIYQCQKGGEISFQDKPCETGSVAKTIPTKVAGTTDAAPWFGLKFGVSPDEVKRRIPGSRTSNGGGKVVSGAVELVRLDKASVGGVDFEAGFFFLGDKFSQSNFSGPMSMKNEDASRYFSRMLEEFRTRFGKESKLRLPEGNRNLSADTEWKTDSGRVWLGIVPITADTSMLLFGFAPKTN